MYISASTLQTCYTHAKIDRIHRDEELRCAICDVHSTRIGDETHLWKLIPNVRTDLPRFVEVCAQCNEEATAAKPKA
jgi:hypothetical protein